MYNLIPYLQTLDIVDEATKDIVEPWRYPDDGWGANPASFAPAGGSDVWTTAGVSSWLSTYDVKTYRDAIERSLKNLASAQNIVTNVKNGADGGWGWKLGETSDSTATAWALFAHTNYVRKSGISIGTYAKHMKPARDWLVRSMHGNAGMPRFPGQEGSLAFNTCWSVIALADCLSIDGLDAPTTRGGINQTLDYVRRTRTIGGWGTLLGSDPDAIGTAYNIFLLQRMLTEGFLGRQTVDDLVNRGAWLRGRQQEDGSWEVDDGSSPVEATAWAIVALLASGENPETSYLVQNGIRYLKSLYTKHAGWPSRPGGRPLVWVTCYACHALWSYSQVMRDIETERERQRQSKVGTTLPKVFIVHGRSDRHKQVVQLLRNHDLSPVILENEPSHGTTQIHEKLLHVLQGIQYAIIIYEKDERAAISPNIPIEWGLITNQLPRNHIWVLRGRDEDPPSNFAGDAYITLDDDGYWKEALIVELREAGLVN